jgi:hypothetical protein
LHGFASSPESTKAFYFFEQFQQIEIPLKVINFNEPDFNSHSIPTLIFHGIYDETIPIESSRSYLTLPPLTYGVTGDSWFTDSPLDDSP